MTSTSDEITNLRTALKAIRTWVGHRIKDGATQGDTVELIAAQLDRALKTPRASKVVEQDTLRLDWVLKHCTIDWCNPCKRLRTTREDLDDMHAP